MSNTDSVVNPQWCAIHGMVRVQRRATLTTSEDSTAKPMTWWECPKCVHMVSQSPTPTPARSEAQWGEPRPDCPRCHGTGTYRLTPDSRLRPCRCGLSERSEAVGGEEGTMRVTIGALEGVYAELHSLRQQLAAAREDGERYADALRDIRDNYDHDEDAHRYDTRCRVCTAVTALRDAGDARYWDDRAHAAAKAARTSGRTGGEGGK